MFQFLRGIVLIAAVVLNCGAAFGQVDLNSANKLMPACRNFAADSKYAEGDANYFSQGVCVGTVETLVLVGPALKNGGACAPRGSTTAQAVRVVVQYIDNQPGRQHENFKVLAYEALQAAWPCKK